MATACHYDGSQVLFETQGGAETGQYTWGNGLVRRNGEWTLEDGMGSARQMTDGGQVVTSSNAVTAYGQTVAVGGGTASPYGFKGSAGYRSDGDSPAGGSNYLKVGARYYDAEWGRFLTRDTNLSQKPYQYCGGDPVNFSDPTGHDATDDLRRKLLEQAALAAAAVALAALGLAGAAIGTALGGTSALNNVTANPGAGTLGLALGSASVTAGGLNGVGSPSIAVTGTATAGSATVTSSVTYTSGGGLSYDAGASVGFGRGFSLGYSSGGGVTLDYTFSLGRNKPPGH